MKERVLLIPIEKALEAFAGKKWKLYSVEDTENRVKVEGPITSGESYVVYLKYKSEAELKDIKAKLEANEFMEQEIQIVSDY